MKAGEADKINRDTAGHHTYQPGAQAIPKMDPNWDFRDNTGEGRLRHLRNMILKGIQAAGRKPINWSQIQEITQEAKENPSACLERLWECPCIYTNIDQTL